MSDDEKEREQIIREEDEYGNILVYPAWTKKNKLILNKFNVIHAILAGKDPHPFVLSMHQEKRQCPMAPGTY